MDPWYDLEAKTAKISQSVNQHFEMVVTNVSYILQNTDYPDLLLTRPSRDFLINDGARYFIELVLGHVFQISLQTCGIASNLVNIVVFLDIGLADSLTVTLFGLSIADLFNLVCYLSFRVIGLCLREVDAKSQIYLTHLSFVFIWYAAYFNDVSMYLTVFSAVQKCCCVAMPLRFKEIFTRNFGAIGTVAIFVLTFTILLPILSAITFHPQSNVSIVNIGVGIDGRYILNHYERSVTIWRWMNRVGLTLGGQVTMIICLVIIVVSLETSAKFRRSTQQQTNASASEPLISKNELRAIRAVQIICYIFVFTKIPATVASLTTEFIPEFASPYYGNVRMLVLNLIFCTGTFNASINIFVYMKYNTKYKRAFLEIFGLKTRKRNSKKVG